MAKVYKLTLGSETYSIPSIEYIKEYIKSIEDKLNITLGTNLGASATVKLTNITEEDVEIGLSGLSTTSDVALLQANNIETDTEHMFMSKALIDSLKDKPTQFEVQESVEAVKTEMEKKIRSSYINLLNTPDALTKLKNIAALLQEDENLNSLINSMASKVDVEEYNNHVGSKYHLSNSDRKALNLLLKAVSNGSFADWNADVSQYSYIRNKPTALPADGGEADNIKNHSLNDIVNRDIYDLVIGYKGSAYYSDDSCNLLYELGSNQRTNEFNSAISSLYNRYGGNVLIKRGVYGYGDLILQPEYPVHIAGANQFTVISAKSMYVNGNITLQNMKITDADIYAKNADGFTFRDVTFVNCCFNFLYTINSRIINCKFENCTINYSALVGNIITGNQFKKTEMISGYAVEKDNAIANNITIQ